MSHVLLSSVVYPALSVFACLKTSIARERNAHRMIFPFFLNQCLRFPEVASHEMLVVLASNLHVECE
ncbi:hypothetical protein Y032_0414g1033 [Ancylostoma ceylanicum]|nr:hypothetical protein Y032_0414g1033 [Ancylostoma ceylanicum]